MSIIRRTLKKSWKNDDSLLVNPLFYRPIIFRAIKETFPTEMTGRICHFTTRNIRGKSNTVRSFYEESNNLETSFTVTKSGHTYAVEGTVRTKATGDVCEITGYVKSIPQKKWTPKDVRKLSVPATVSRILMTLSRLEEEVKSLKRHLDSPSPSNISFLPNFEGPLDVDIKPILIPTLPPDAQIADSSNHCFNV